MMRTAQNLPRLLGLALGVGLMALLVLSWRVPAGSGRLGADVELIGTPPGELALEPSGKFASARELSPGRGEAAGSLRVRNVAGRPLAVRVRALPSTRDLDKLLTLELKAGGRVIHRGPVGNLRRWSRQSFEVPAKRPARLRARAWLPSRAGDGWRGRIAGYTIELKARPSR